MVSPSTAALIRIPDFRFSFQCGNWFGHADAGKAAGKNPRRRDFGFRTGKIARPMAPADSASLYPADGGEAMLHRRSPGNCTGNTATESDFNANPRHTRIEELTGETPV